MEGVIMETIMERRGPSLDVLVNGERVMLATKWWWSVAKIGSSDDEIGKISTSDGPGGAVDEDAECDEEGKTTLSSDSSSESSEDSM
jgi:hypothetical protein